jgi:8-oxo-dGTP pyrophosphatase MutT (NUDIX family)
MSGRRIVSSEVKPLTLPAELASRVAGRLTTITREDGHVFRVSWFTNADSSPMGAVSGALVLPFTPEDEVVLIRQRRHPIGGGFAVELPGGALSLDEDPALAIKRQLLEKTGYEAEEVRPLGQVRLWNAFSDGGSHQFVAYGCRKVADPILTEFQMTNELEVIKATLAEITERTNSGDPEWHDPTLGDTIFRYLVRSGRLVF